MLKTDKLEALKGGRMMALERREKKKKKKRRWTFRDFNIPADQ